MSKIGWHSPYLLNHDRPFTIPKEEEVETEEPCEECGAWLIYNADIGQWRCPECELSKD